LVFKKRKKIFNVKKKIQFIHSGELMAIYLAAFNFYLSFNFYLVKFNFYL